ncbi:hypothetical protein DBR28_11470 [Chryseobacterium sp. HMWF028]|nr:hypothetical protein DBR28_11470 [Chryseobacterium sp. HMWF028]
MNADENVQVPFNTQNYNRYGYVMNNPLMYNDPNGEFIWIVAGAVIGAYVTGVKANGSWNPVKWNWGATWGKIVVGGAVGAFTGGVGSLVGASALTAAATVGINGGILGGAIAGATGGAVAGAINGLATAVMFGEDVIEGTLMGGLTGAVAGGVVGGVAGGIQRVAANAKAVTTGAQQGTILKNAPIEVGRSQWTLNNTPKTTTLGATPTPTPKTANLVIGNVDGGYADEVIGFQLIDEGATSIPIYKETPKFSYQGESTFTKSLVQTNRDAGNAFRDELAAALRAEGREVTTEAFKKTPYGKRFMDIEVIMPNGKPAGIETKVGGSRYHTLQRLKDDWLRDNGYPVQVVRKATK